ncbi:hypothetical protein KIH41_08620 [Litoribacter ruber]|uniref:hypothetical protein n=1 Tax=Litoribacter ruber TaxID=702568 RepID=UPI001BD91CD4|nr:hypothetical protein [Litoribacter ruber]MBT0811341.1 hypothetical protein [Litoribacter ruber]
MKVKNYLGILFLATAAIGCVSPPENFPSAPEISFSRVEFVPIQGAPDSLIVSVDFKDAEGDLGLGPRDFNPPFQPFDYVLTETGSRISYSNRPPDAPSYNPRDWRILDPMLDNVTVRDTLWIKPNPDHNNIFVRFFIKRGGDYQEFVWEGPPYYTTFNGRFPRILTDDRERAIEGNISYGMLSSGWQAIFRNDTIRLDVQIQDRQLNRSNTVSTPDFTLNQVTRR